MAGKLITELFGNAFDVGRGRTFMAALHAARAISTGNDDGTTRDALRDCLERLAEDLLGAAEEGESLSVDKVQAFRRIRVEAQLRGIDARVVLQSTVERSTLAEPFSVLGLEET